MYPAVVRNCLVTRLPPLLIFHSELKEREKGKERGLPLLIIMIKYPVSHHLKPITFPSSIFTISFILLPHFSFFLTHSFSTLIHHTHRHTVGLIYHRINFQCLTVVCMTITMICNVMIPYNTEFVGLIATFMVNGLAGGLIGSGANLFLIQLWGKENPPFLQALHFSYGVGALLAPLIAKPFLLPLNPGDDRRSSHVPLNGTSMPAHEIEYAPGDVMLMYPYGIVAACHMIPIGIFIMLYRLHPVTDQHPSRVVVVNMPLDADRREKGAITDKREMRLEAAGVESSPSPAATPSTFWKKVMIAFILVFALCSYGIELTYGSYLTTFAVKSASHLDKGTGAYMTSLYWTVFTFFRLSTIFYIDYIGPESNIMMNVTLIIVSNILIFPFADNSPLCLWIGTFFMGIGNSSIFASIFGFIENYFPVSNKVASALMVSSFCGEFVFPVIVSHFMEDRPTIFLEVTLACTVCLAASFALAVAVARSKLSLLKT